MARVYADVNAQMPRAYWDYDSVNISWGILENYEVVRKIGTLVGILYESIKHPDSLRRPRQILRSLRRHQHR